MATYDILAPHYDAVTGDCAAEAALIQTIVDGRCPQARTVLDVACGTGAITAALCREFEVAGLDIAPGMLAAAREKLPTGVPLHLADMTSFDLGVRFDAIVCAYQGVNHLLSFPAWESFFACAARHLNPGGVLVFDIATAGHLATMAGSGKIVQEFGGNYVVLTVCTTGAASFEWHIEVFELQPDRSYRLLTQTIQMSSFPVARIRAALDPWFGDIEILGDGDAADPDHKERVWLVASRPS